MRITVPTEKPAGDPLLEGDFAPELVHALRMTLQILLVIVPVLFVVLLMAPDVSLAQSAAMGALFPLLIGLRLLLRAGHLQWVFSGVVVMLIVFGIVSVAQYGSIRSSSSLSFVGAIVLGGIFMPPRALLAALVACVAAVGALVYAEQAGWLPAPHYTVTVVHWLVYSIVLASIALNIYYARRMVVRSLRRMHEQRQERQRAESALGETQDLFGSLFRNSPAALIITRQPGGQVHDVNEAYERTFLITRAAAVGRTTSELGLWESDAARDDYIAELVRDRHASNRRMRFRRHGGEVFDAIISTEHLEWQGAMHLFSTITDISAEMKAREALKASEERFSKAFHFSPIGMTITRVADGTIIEVNGADERTLGYKRAETLGRSTLDNGAWLTPEARVQFVDELNRTGRVLGYEGQMLTKSGDLIEVRVYAERIELNGESCVLAATLNVSEEKRHASQIQALNETLERRVRERTVQLESANAELEAFSYSVSHDLRSPLRAIDGFTRMLAAEMEGRLTPEEDALLERIVDNGRRMNHLIDDLLNLSKLGRGTFARTSTDLSALASNVAQRMSERDPGRRVEWDIATGLSAECDAGMAQIVLDNLLGNAWKYTGNRAVSKIRFGAERQERGGICWFVADDGAGFDMKYAGRLFTPFQRMHSAEEFEGSGIGLAIVHRIIARHGGRIWVEAAPGMGATFRFTLEPD